MASSARQKETLTPKGQRTRVRIVDATAHLIYERGVTATTLDDVKAAAAVSNSQLYHYFANKEALVRAVIDRRPTRASPSQSMPSWAPSTVSRPGASLS